MGRQTLLEAITRGSKLIRDNLQKGVTVEKTEVKVVRKHPIQETTTTTTELENVE